jgi:talin
MTEINAKYRYVQLCRSLKTYGITFFHCKSKVKGKTKPKEVLLGITREGILFMDPETNVSIGRIWGMIWGKLKKFGRSC